MHPSAEHIDVGWWGDPVDDPDVPTLVMLHGWGASGADLVGLLPVIGSFLPGVTVKVLVVRGFFPLPERPGGMSWFPGSVMRQPSAAAIAETADRLVDVVGRHTNGAVWLGFSQGMSAAIAVLRRRPELVRGLVGLSGFTFAAAQPGDAPLLAAVAAGHGVPAFYGRDPHDPVIPGLVADWVLDFLRRHTALTERSYPGMGHSVSPEEIADLAGFLTPLLTPG